MSDTPVTLTKEAKEFLIKSVKEEGKTAVKLSVVFGTDSQGVPRFKYELQTVDGPDEELDLGDGVTLIVDGNALPVLRGTSVEFKQQKDENGNVVQQGFIFDNPNVPAMGGGCSGCPSNAGGGCSTGGCSSE